MFDSKLLHFFLWVLDFKYSINLKVIILHHAGKWSDFINLVWIVMLHVIKFTRSLTCKFFALMQKHKKILLDHNLEFENHFQIVETGFHLRFNKMGNVLACCTVDKKEANDNSITTEGKVMVDSFGSTCIWPWKHLVYLPHFTEEEIKWKF